jgi:hypothetical protein
MSMIPLLVVPSISLDMAIISILMRMLPKIIEVMKLF